MKAGLITGCLVVVLTTGAVSQQDTLSPWKGTFERHRLNYVLAGFTLNEQIKFQISVRYRIFNALPLYFAYSQRSFWDLYDWDNSTPFRESNYMPELFYRIQGTHETFFEYLQLGLEHESNGRSGLESRSWNKIVAGGKAILIHNWVHVDVRYWVPFAIADENKDIRSFLGDAEIGYILFLFPDPANNHLEITMRAGGSHLQTFTVVFDLMIKPLTSMGWDVFGANPYIMVQLWHGYGESLIDYNVKTTRFRVGFTL